MKIESMLQTRHPYAKEITTYSRQINKKSNMCYVKTYIKFEFDVKGIITP